MEKKFPIAYTLNVMEQIQEEFGSLERLDRSDGTLEER